MLYRCERCGAEDVMSYRCVYTLRRELVDRDEYMRHQRYSICEGCWNEWHYNGYYDMWCNIFYSTDVKLIGSSELADKFVLDFLGKLG